MMSTVYTSKRILITGGAGFIGSHLCESLVNSGYETVAIDNLSTGKFENIAHLIPFKNFKFVRETVLNEQVMDRLASESEMIIHLAAAVGVKLIVENPVHTINTNIKGTEAVLTAANRYRCKVLIASTSEVYGKGIAIPFHEDDDCLMGPTTHSRWAYATSKAVDEFLGLAYYRQFGVPVIIMRFFNTIGPRQTGQYGMVVPRFIRRALCGEPLEVYGNGQQSRCFVNVADVVDAIVKLSQHPGAIGEVFNIGSTEEVSIIKLAKLILELTGRNSSINFLAYEDAYPPGFDDMLRRVPSIGKINKLIGFHPQFSLKDTLNEIIEFEANRLNI